MYESALKMENHSVDIDHGDIKPQKSQIGYEVVSLILLHSMVEDILVIILAFLMQRRGSEMRGSIQALESKQKFKS